MNAAVAASSTITSIDGLPRWNVVLNAPGQVLGSRDPPTDVLVLGWSVDVASKHQVFVLCTPSRENSQRLQAAMVSIYAHGLRSIGTYVAQDADILNVVASQFGVADATRTAIDDSEVHQRWDEIVLRAYKMGASDIHLNAVEGRSVLLFRLDGELEKQPFMATDAEGIAMISSMYATMADVGSTSDPFNQRVPQSASVTRTYREGKIRLRYEHNPIAPDGMHLTLRLIVLGVHMAFKPPHVLGYSMDHEALIDRIFAHASGIILYIGMVGSGKSTSMANSLMKLVSDNPGKLLRTVEEPVEIIIPGDNVAQSQVQRGIRLSKDEPDPFAVMLRSMVRSDLNYLMVGEIRDIITAHLAIQVARSGHLCVSTLHAGSAPMAIERLAGMGVARNDLATSGLIAGLIYQKLVRVLCPHCKIQASRLVAVPEYRDILDRLHAYVAKDRPELTDTYLDRTFFRNSEGCEHCNTRARVNWGISGRSVCAGILVPTSAMMPFIASGDSVGLIRAWRASIDPERPEIMRGRTAAEHARWKMLGGSVSPVDVERSFQPLDEDVFL